MALLVEELFDWLVAQTGLTPGEDIHCGYLPEGTEGAVAVLLEGPSVPMSPRLRHNLQETQFQVLVVGPTEQDWWDARELAEQIHEVMRDAAAVALGSDWTADVIVAETGPTFIGGDERFRFEISAMYRVRARSAALFAA